MDSIMKKSILAMIIMMITTPTLADDSEASWQLIEDEVEKHVAEPCVDAVVDVAPWDQQDTERTRDLKGLEAHLAQRMPEQLEAVKRENKEFARGLLREQVEEIVQKLTGILVRNNTEADVRMKIYKQFRESCIDSFLSR